jgi:hypothetical protein
MKALGLDASLLAEAGGAGGFNEKENSQMARKPLTRKAALVLGGITAHFAPRFAQDQAIDFTSIVAGINHKNYAERLPVLSAAALKAVEGRLAVDADAEGLAKLLDALAGSAPIEAKDDAEPVTDPSAAPPPSAGELDENKGKDPAVDPAAVGESEGGVEGGGEGAVNEDVEGDGDGDAIAMARSFLASKLSPEDMNHFNSLVAKIGAEETPATDSEEQVDPGAQTETASPADGEVDPNANDEEDNDMVTRPAMDAALTAAVAAERAFNKATFSAKESVEAAIGKVVTCDSATDYYRLGLKAFGVKGVDTLPSAVLKVTFDTLAEARKGAAVKPTPKIAQDASAAAEYAKRYPNANRLVR